MAGVSLVELMVGITLGLIILAGLASVFANNSRARNEIERAARQIENGRYSMELIGDDIRMAGFYGELSVNSVAIPGALPDPCSTDPTVWATALRVAVQGYDNGVSAPSCMPSDYVTGTDILVVRHAAGCEAGATNCDAAVAGTPYFQAAKCGTQVAAVNTSYEVGLQGTAAFGRQLKDCATAAGKRRYVVDIYFLSSNNGLGQAIPSLKRLELDPANASAVAGFNEVTLVEGIERLNYEYGVDTDADGQPNGWTADPTNYNPAGCVGCTDVNNWSNVVAIRVNLVARNTDETPTYTDNKTYTLGLDASGNAVTYTPNDHYHRHAYNTVVRVVNVSQRRELP